MGLQLIPIAVGTAVGAAAAYVITDQQFRSRITDGPRQLGRRINAYFTGPSAGPEQTEPTTQAVPAEPQPQPVWQAHQGFTDLSANDEQTDSDTPTSEQKTPLPTEQLTHGLTGLSTGDEHTESPIVDAGQQAPQPTRQPDQHRCQALTKAGNRCRSRTHAIVSMSRSSNKVAEVALCSVHSGIHEKGGVVTLVDETV